MRPASSPGCGSPGCWCGCGSARPIRDRSPGIPSRSLATRGRTEHRCGTGAGGSPPGSPCPVCAIAGAGDGALPRSTRERPGSPARNATPSTPTRPARPPWRRSTSAAAPTVIPAAAADAAWAAADSLHVAARALRSRELRCAADAYDRAARAPHGRLPRRSRDGDQLRRTARLIALAGDITGDSTLTAIALVANLVALAAAVAELRQAQQHAAQSAAAHAAARHLHTAMTQARWHAPRPAQAHTPRRSKASSVADIARRDFPVPPRPGDPFPAQNGQPSQTSPGLRRHRGQGPVPAQRAGPSR